MPQRNSSRRTVSRLLLFSLAGWILWALGKSSARPQDSHPEPASAVPDPWNLDRELDEVEPAPRRTQAGFSKRRLATSLAFATLFFAGASFSAGAGDALVDAVEGAETTAATTSTEEAPAEEPAPEPEPESAPAEEPAPAPEPESAPAEEPAPEEEPAPDEEPGSEEPAAEGPGSEEPAPEEPVGGEPVPDPGDEAPDGGDPVSEKPSGPDAGGGAPVVRAPAAPEGEHDHAHDHELEFEGAESFATVWLHRTLPDPIAPAARLSPAFARRLEAAAARAGVDWALVLAVLRAEGRKSSAPAKSAHLHATARALAQAGARKDAWRAVLALKGRTAFADRALALRNYYRAAGLEALVSGLQAAKPALEDRVLRDFRLDIYSGGRADVASGKVDVRVLVTMLYLAEAHGQVTVSSLRSGHRFFSRPGVPSAHVYGLAVDVAALEGRPILGNSEPGGVTERAVRNLLLLPAELQARQIISLLGLGGPSFPLGDHGDHIHIGF